MCYKHTRTSTSAAAHPFPLPGIQEPSQIPNCNLCTDTSQPGFISVSLGLVGGQKPSEMKAEILLGWQYTKLSPDYSCFIQFGAKMSWNSSRVVHLSASHDHGEAGNNQNAEWKGQAVLSLLLYPFLWFFFLIFNIFQALKTLGKKAEPTKTSLEDFPFLLRDLNGIRAAERSFVSWLLSIDW